MAEVNILILTGNLITLVFVTGLFLMGFIFILRVKRAKESKVELSPFIGMAMLFFGYALSEIFFIYNYFFIMEGGQELLVNLMYKGAVMAGFAGIIGVTFFSEKVVGKTKYAFTIFSVICFSYLTIFLHTEVELRQFSYFTMPVGLIILVVYFIYSLKIITKGVIRRKMGGAFLCALGFLFFFLLDTGIGKMIVPLPVELTSIIADTGSLSTLIVWGYLFLSIDTFTEFGWEDKMKEIYIISPAGITQFHYSFGDKSSSQRLDLVSSGLTGVKEIIAEMVQSEQVLKVVDHQDIKILFEHGTYSTVALIAYENLHIFHSKLTALTKQFENLFQDVLSQWTGDTDVFLPTKRLIEDIFC